MKCITIKNSYNEWLPNSMHNLIKARCFDKYNTFDADKLLNRTYRGMFLEWYFHNIGYFLTLPFIKNNKIKNLNDRFKDLDLEEHLK